MLNADFTPPNSGETLIITGNQNFFYLFNLEQGSLTKIVTKDFLVDRIAPCPNGELVAFLSKNGQVKMLSTKTWRVVQEVSAGAGIKDFQWVATVNTNTPQLQILTNKSEVQRWEVRKSSMPVKCLNKWYDTGIGFGLNRMALSLDDRWLALSSESGMVGLYSTDAANQKDPELVKLLKQLVTPVTHLKFFPDAQGLIFASQTKNDQIRIAHLPTGKVFNNWPPTNAPIGTVTSLDMSPSGSLISVGNHRGKVLLYRLKHYSSSFSSQS